MIFYVIIGTDLTFSQTCDEITEKIDRISEKITTDDTKLVNFQTDTNSEITGLKKDNNELHSRLNLLYLKFNNQLYHLTQRIDTSRRTNINLNNASNLLEIFKIQSIKIVDLTSKIIYLNDIVSYFDAKFRILERRAKLKENDESYQEQLESFKTKMEIMKIFLYIAFGLFVTLKLMIICKWCCCKETTTSKTFKTDEIEMKSSKQTTKSNNFDNPNKIEETVIVYENMNHDTTKTARIGGRKLSKHFKNSVIGTIPKTITNLKSVNHGYHYNESSDELYNNAEHDESQMYDSCEFDNSLGASQQNSNYPPIPPKDFLRNKNLEAEEIYYDEFNDGLTDDSEAFYDDVYRESIGGLGGSFRIEGLKKT